MVTGNYEQREFDFGSDYSRGSGLESDVVKRDKKKSKLLRNLVITGVVAGGLVYGVYKGLEFVGNMGIGEGALILPITIIESSLE